jgi:hypothetical protein
MEALALVALIVVVAAGLAIGVATKPKTTKR